MPATSKVQEGWSAAEKLASILHAACLSDDDFGAYRRERGLFPKQHGRWRQVAEDANNHRMPSMSDQKGLQIQNHEWLRQNRHVVREATAEERRACQGINAALVCKKARSPLDTDRDEFTLM